MSKNFDVIIERVNGAFRALIPALPNIAAEGATRYEAVNKAKAAAQRYLEGVEVTTIELAERPADEEELLSQEEARARLIEALEQLEPQTELDANLISLRLQMLRAGQRLRSLDEINRELGRGSYADVP